MHIWGTEYPEAAAMQDAAAAANLPVLISIQGVMRDNCAVPTRATARRDAYRHSGGLLGTPLIRSFPANCWTTCKPILTFWRRRKPAVLGKARCVTGRTGFDRRAAAALAPAARYYPCNVGRAPCFTPGRCGMCGSLAARRYCFCPKRNYPLKNLHTVIRALPAVRQQFPGATLHIAGAGRRWTKARFCGPSSTACSPINSTASGWQRSWAWPMLCIIPARWMPPPCARRT